MHRRDGDKAGEEKHVEQRPAGEDLRHEERAADHLGSAVTPQGRQFAERIGEVAATACGESDLDALVQFRQGEATARVVATKRDRCYFTVSVTDQRH